MSLSRLIKCKRRFCILISMLMREYKFKTGSYLRKATVKRLAENIGDDHLPEEEELINNVFEVSWL
jgi:hypothetical protein